MCNVERQILQNPNNLRDNLEDLVTFPITSTFEEPAGIHCTTHESAETRLEITISSHFSRCTRDGIVENWEILFGGSASAGNLHFVTSNRWLTVLVLRARCTWNSPVTIFFLYSHQGP